MSVMFSISASLCKAGNELMLRSGSTQEILVLLQEQYDRQASVDIHRSPEPTAIPSSATQPNHRSGHREPVPGKEGAPLPAPHALISGANLPPKRPWPGSTGRSAPGFQRMGW